MPSKINLDRGVITWRLPVDRGGMYVNMYVDDPGVYLNDHGHKVTEELASEVGADVKRWRKERIKRERLAAAKSKIEAELDMLSEELETAVKEKNGFVIIELPGDRANVKDPDGVLMNTMPISMVDAEKLLDALTADGDPDHPVEPVKPAKGK